MVKKKTKKSKKRLPRKAKPKAKKTKAVKKTKAARKTVKKAPARKKTVKALPISVQKKDINMMEDETFKRVRATLASIEGFLGKWNSSKEQPENMRGEVLRLQRYKKALKKWQRDAEKAKKKKETVGGRMERLREFIMICFTYS